MAGIADKSPALTVSEAVGLASRAVGALPTLTVTGEVTGYRGPNARSGHYYFDVKDESCVMSVKLWRGVFEKAPLELRDGLRVQMTGTFSVYEQQGSLGFVVKTIRRAGEGDLLAQLAELRRRLRTEGLMDDTRKRPIPRFCERICVVTSLSGSVLFDVKRTLARRNPLVEIQEVNCATQGEHAPATIIRALDVAAAAQPDCILLVRGGGSTENLMPFNDEGVARAVAACPVPVIVAVGHEDDSCICEDVADRRCSTPTAAAESVAPALDEIVESINARHQRLASALSGFVSSSATELDSCARRGDLAMRSLLAQRKTALEGLAASHVLRDPSALVTDRVDALAQSEQRLLDALPRQVDLLVHNTSLVADRLESCSVRLTKPFSAEAVRMSASLAACGRRLLVPYRDEVGHAAKMLDAYSPLGVLSRGYAIVRDAAGHVVTDATSMSAGDGMSVMLAHGSVDATVTGVRVEDGRPAEKNPEEGFEKSPEKNH